MIPPFISVILLLLGHGLAWLGWRWFVPKEVAKNDQDITANGAQDSLRKAYHARRTRIRGAVAVVLALVGSSPAMIVGNVPCYVLSCAAIIAGVATYFARWFTPLLNIARYRAGRKDITEWYVSSDSASWPDAAIYKKLRAEHPEYTPVQLAYSATLALHALLTRTYRLGLACYALLLAGAGALLFLK